ncbi:MAG: histidine kinase [Gammaproteobacteria bacterium]|nr:MAG: histidine kinase [Gammaproteobacteria bacterium]
MGFRRFSVLLIVRLVLAGIAGGVTVWLFLQPGLHSLTLLSAVLLVGLVGELWWYVSRTNREITRFLDAARHADYSQRFDFENVGAGFEELANTFSEILEKISAVRSNQEMELRRLRALIDHTPIPLLTIHGDDTITLQNNSARRMFGSAQVTRLKDLRQFGVSFYTAVNEAVPGNRELVSFSVDGVEYKLTLATTENIVAGEAIRLVSLQDIQSELDMTQADAWQDLVRVLTHEIMNSITPVRSLATTAAEVVEDIAAKTESDSPIRDDIDDLRDALNTLQKRSNNLMEFVNSYRQLTRLAPPEKKRMPIRQLFESVATIAAAEWPDSKQILTYDVDPEGLDVYADQVLLEPVLLNLLRNAWQATLNTDNPKIEMRGRFNSRGNVVIDVSDNGPGVPDDLTRKIFVPFFTTKEQGSGVGLALARQVMTAHGGYIRLAQDGAGAKFSLTF